MQFDWFFLSFFVWKIVYHKQTLVLNLAKATQVFLSVRPFHTHVVSFECYVSWCVLKITLFFLSWKSLFIHPCQFLRVCLTIFLMFFHFRIVDHIRRGHSALTRILGQLSSFGGFVKTTIQLLPWMVTALNSKKFRTVHLLEVKIFICLDNLWVDLSLPKMVSLLCASGFVCSCCQPFVKDVVLVGFTHLIPVRSAFKLTTRTVEHDNDLSFFFQFLQVHLVIDLQNRHFVIKACK